MTDKQHSYTTCPIAKSSMSALARRWQQPGFTLLELLVVVSIVAILLALVAAAIQRARQAAARVACASNLRQVGLAIHMYHDAQNHLPVGCDYPSGTVNPEVFFVGMSWHTSILPYIEQERLGALARAAYATRPQGNNAEHNQLRRNVISTYLCPSETYRTGGYPNIDLTWANTSYMGVAGSGTHSDDGIFHPGFRVRLLDITDGTTNTLMVGERPPGKEGVYSGWYSFEGQTNCQVSQILPTSDPINFVTGTNCDIQPAPEPLRPGKSDGCHLSHFWSLHAGGANFAFADGSVRFLSYDASPILLALSTRAGGEFVQP